MTMLRDRATRRTKTIAVVTLPVVLVAAFALASYTSLFATRDIRIEGAVTLTRQDVLRDAGVGPGTNVFHLDADAVERALVADPWIATASVERHLRDRRDPGAGARADRSNDDRIRDVRPGRGRRKILPRGVVGPTAQDPGLRWGSSRTTSGPARHERSPRSNRSSELASRRSWSSPQVSS